MRDNNKLKIMRGDSTAANLKAVYEFAPREVCKCVNWSGEEEKGNGRDEVSMLETGEEKWGLAN